MFEKSGASQLIGKGVVINLAYHSVLEYVVQYYWSTLCCIRKKYSLEYSSILQSTLLKYHTRYVLSNEVHNVHCCTGVQYCKTNYCTDVQYCTTDSPEYLVHWRVCVGFSNIPRSTTWMDIFVLQYTVPLSGHTP